MTLAAWLAQPYVGRPRQDHPLNLLGPTFLVVLVIGVMLAGALTMFLAMRTSIRRGREARERRAKGVGPDS